MIGNRFRHRDDLLDTDEVRTIRKSRIFYAILSALYLVAVVSATLYVVVIKPARMPRVEAIGRGEISAVIPKTCIVESADGSPVVNILREEQGPWGMQYFVNQVLVTETLEFDEESVFVPDVIVEEGAIITDSTAESLENGMEVRLAQLLPAVE